MPLTPKGLDTRQWKHKLLPYTFIQSKNTGNTSWYTGVFRKKLIVVAEGKVKSVLGNVTATTRAQYILHQQNEIKLHGRPSVKKSKEKEEKAKPAPVPFSFEQNLDHWINEAKMMIANGLPGNFFECPYVKKTLEDLEPRHRPAYRLKLVRLIRCIIDESGAEVSHRHKLPSNVIVKSLTSPVSYSSTGS